MLTVVDKAGGSSLALSLPGVYRVSVNPGGTVAIAFVQNSNFIYYVRKLSAARDHQPTPAAPRPGRKPPWIANR